MSRSPLNPGSLRHASANSSEGHLVSSPISLMWKLRPGEGQGSPKRLPSRSLASGPPPGLPPPHVWWAQPGGAVGTHSTGLQIPCRLLPAVCAWKSYSTSLCLSPCP